MNIEIANRLQKLRKENGYSQEELADKLGISRVAAKKRVKKLEDEGIIRQYNTYIKRDDEITMLIDIITTPDGFDRVLEYVATRTVYVRQIFTTMHVGSKFLNEDFFHFSLELNSIS